MVFESYDMVHINGVFLIFEMNVWNLSQRPNPLCLTTGTYIFWKLLIERFQWCISFVCAGVRKQTKTDIVIGHMGDLKRENILMWLCNGNQQCYCSLFIFWTAFTELLIRYQAHATFETNTMNIPFFVLYITRTKGIFTYVVEDIFHKRWLQNLARFWNCWLKMKKNVIKMF